MAVPASGAITLGKIRMEIRATSANNNYDNGPAYMQTSLQQASTGNHEALNQNNQQTYNIGPDYQSPHEMSEWYSYNHLLMS